MPGYLAVFARRKCTCGRIRPDGLSEEDYFYIVYMLHIVHRSSLSVACTRTFVLASKCSTLLAHSRRLLCHICRSSGPSELGTTLLFAISIPPRPSLKTRTLGNVFPIGTEYFDFGESEFRHFFQRWLPGKWCKLRLGCWGSLSAGWARSPRSFLTFMGHKHRG